MDMSRTDRGADGTPPSQASTADDELGSIASLLTAVARTADVLALAPGTIVGDQYRIEEAVGEGAMGVVYRAHDQRLDRDVAVKVGIAVTAPALERIEREAKALARLAHPNVVVVHQVGTIGGRVFIALEHVGGGTARDWLEARDRSWREIVALYAAAGDGLAAAHAAGLVHRDIKPGNILVGSDGRPRIADFGVVGAASSTGSQGIAGTPGYMAPEQAAGEPVDARADQYAFAVSAWEALFDARPAADPAPPGRTRRRPPRRLVAALRRALSRRADDRWPSLDPLLRELRRDPRRGQLAAGGFAVAAAAAAAAFALWPSAPEPCQDAAVRIADVWNAEQRAALVAKAAGIATPLADAIDRRAGEWIASHTAACKATRVDGLASDELLDQRMFCLAQRRAELAAVVSTTLAGDAGVIAAAGPFLDGLPRAAACLDPEIADGAPAPKDPDTRRKIDAAQPAIAEAQAAAIDRGKLDPLGKTTRAVELARASGWAPTIAAALALRGQVLYELDQREEALAVLEEAARTALAARSDHDAAYAYVDGAKVLADLGRLPEAQRMLVVARSLWERNGKPADVGWRVHQGVAHLAQVAGKPREMLAAVRAQVALSREAFGDDAVMAGADRHNLSIALLAAGELDEAVTTAEAAVAAYIRALGDHPTVASARGQAVMASLRAGKLDAAFDHGTRATATIERWFGPDDPRLVPTLTMVGDIHRQRGELDRARELQLRALAILRAKDPKSPRVGQLEQNLAIVALNRGDLADARQRAYAALAAYEARLGPDNLGLLDVLPVVAAVLREGPTPDLDASLRHLDRAVAIATRELPDGHRGRLNLLIERSYTLTMLDRGAEAVAELMPWYMRLGSLQLGAQTPNELRFALAKAQLASGAVGKACAFSREAEDGYRAIDSTVMLAEVARWRDTHCKTGLPR
jgi:tetratricopeptide (TPR) repeat protein